MEDREKLTHLLKHWIEHNQEHAAEFRQWAVKAGDIGNESVVNNILEAANQLEKADEFLSSALTAMNDV